MKTAVIAAFNEEKTIGHVISNLSSLVDHIIVVDDGSHDSTARVAEHAGTTVISNPYNVGYDRSIIIGLKHALELGAEYIITVDADGQHPICSVSSSLRMIETRKASLVIGRRQRIPRVSEAIFSIMSRVRYGVPDITCGLKCYSKEALSKYLWQPAYDSVGTFVALNILKHKGTVLIVECPVLERGDLSRYGSTLATQYKILKALIYSLPLLGPN